MPHNIIALLNNEAGRAMIEEACKENGFLLGPFEELVQAEVEHIGKQRRTRLWDRFDDILDRIVQEDN